MITLHQGGTYLINGKELLSVENAASYFKAKNMNVSPEQARQGTIAWSILQAHNQSDDPDFLRIKFDAMASHDITFVGIIQTAKSSGMTHFPLPYVLTNCHNSLCAVGGTINEDDHVFGLSAAKKYGGIYVPPHMAVIHQYMRETMAGCGKMILGSDSHTRYGALGTMAVGEGGGELVKQLLNNTWDIACPEVVGVYLKGNPQNGVGPQDIALAIIGAVFKNGFVKNKVMEFIGPGIASLQPDYRNGIDVMTTETACLTSIWQTDAETRTWFVFHDRPQDYRELKPADITYYDGMIEVDLDKIKPMIALPFHPSNVFTIDEVNENPEDIFRQVEKDAEVLTKGTEVHFSLRDKIVNGKVLAQQGIIAGCAGGTWSNIKVAADYLAASPIRRDDFTLNVYPSSQPVFMDLMETGDIARLMTKGAVVKTAFCGPCFGAGDTPANNALSLRHTTRNFPNREGSKPGAGQLAAVALMDSRSIAATAANGGILTSALGQCGEEPEMIDYQFDDCPYRARVADYWGKAQSDSALIYGPNIKDWPEMSPLSNHILLKICSKIMDDVTTTDELIPSGETSSYRSNPLGLAEFTLSRRDPEYVGRSKAVNYLEKARNAGKDPVELDPELEFVYKKSAEILPNVKPESIEIGSMIYCVKPGDGSAREQAASCQRVIGGLANICQEYATKRYRSNVINWGMLPFQMKEMPTFEVGDWILVPDAKDALNHPDDIPAYVLKDEIKKISLYLAPMTETEKAIVQAGCLINYNKENCNE